MGENGRERLRESGEKGRERERVKQVKLELKLVNDHHMGFIGDD